MCHGTRDNEISSRKAEVACRQKMLTNNQNTSLRGRNHIKKRSYCALIEDIVVYSVFSRLLIFFIVLIHIQRSHVSDKRNVFHKTHQGQVCRVFSPSAWAQYFFRTTRTKNFDKLTPWPQINKRNNDSLWGIWATNRFDRETTSSRNHLPTSIDAPPCAARTNVLPKMKKYFSKAHFQLSFGALHEKSALGSLMPYTIVCFVARVCLAHGRHAPAVTKQKVSMKNYCQPLKMHITRSRVGINASSVKTRVLWTSWTHGLFRFLWFYMPSFYT